MVKQTKLLVHSFLPTPTKTQDLGEFSTCACYMRCPELFIQYFHKIPQLASPSYAARWVKIFLFLFGFHQFVGFSKQIYWQPNNSIYEIKHEKSCILFQLKLYHFSIFVLASHSVDQVVSFIIFKDYYNFKFKNQQLQKFQRLIVSNKLFFQNDSIQTLVS